MKILVVDLETGMIDAVGDPFDPGNCVICEIGIVRLDLATGEVSEVVNKICREGPPCHGDSWIFRNSSLTLDQVSCSITLADLRNDVQFVLAGGLPVTSWGHGFDLRILESRGYAIPLRFWDPLRTLAPYLGMPSPYGYGWKWPSVEEAYAFFHPWKALYTLSHRAVEDALTEASIIYDATVTWPELTSDWSSYI